MGNKEKYRGIVTTFYSYKGGTGRSMALANLACLMAKEAAEPILVIDWDLEAPGLHDYFANYLPDGFEEKEGLIEFCAAAISQLPAMQPDEENTELLHSFYDALGNYVIQLEQLPNVFFLKAGRFDENYGNRVANFDWQGFFEKIPSFFPLWAKYLRKNFAYIFIDSRTGHGDAPGISTMLMPEKLVLVFTPNRQSLNGVLELAKKAIHYRRHSDDYRPLTIYPLPSRVELGEESLRRQWQHDYAQKFEETLRSAYGLSESISLSDYFESVQIPHSPRFAYGEEIAVLLESSRDINSMSLRYVALQQQMFGVKNIWSEKDQSSAPEKPIKVWILYAREDQSHKDILKKHLQPLLKSRQIVAFWADQILVEKDESMEILQRAPDTADLIVLLVSSDFLASGFIWQKDFSKLLKHPLSSLNILPVILRPCDWKDTPLNRFQVVPHGGRPVSSFSDLDEAYLQTTEAIREIATKSRKIHA